MKYNYINLLVMLVFLACKPNVKGVELKTNALGEESSTENSIQTFQEYVDNTYLSHWNASAVHSVYEEDMYTMIDTGLCESHLSVDYPYNNSSGSYRYCFVSIEEYYECRSLESICDKYGKILHEPCSDLHSFNEEDIKNKYSVEKISFRFFDSENLSGDKEIRENVLYRRMYDEMDMDYTFHLNENKKITYAVKDGIVSEKVFEQFDEKGRIVSELYYDAEVEEDSSSMFTKNSLRYYNTGRWFKVEEIKTKYYD